MSKILLVSGSNRIGNTEYILKRLSESLEESELILLRNKNIQYCKGCLLCHKNLKCFLQDDMKNIIEKIIKSEIIVFGIPNYFDNVTGLFKNFIDRLHPLYKSEQLKGKKVVFIFVGGGSEIGTQKSLHESIKGMSKYLFFHVIAEFSFKALNQNDVKLQENKIKEIEKEIKNIEKEKVLPY